MMIRARLLLCILVCSLFTLGGAGATRATTLARMSIEQMARTAPLIVRAHCLRKAAAWDAGEIWTVTTFEVEDVWKGSASREVSVRLLGGNIGHLTSSVAGVPRFRAGEEAVLFLEPARRGDYTIVSWQQGTFRIWSDAHAGGENVTQDTASMETSDPSARRFEAGGIRAMSLGELKSRVTSALQREKEVLP